MAELVTSFAISTWHFTFKCSQHILDTLSHKDTHTHAHTYRQQLSLELEMFVDFIAKAIEIKVCNLCRGGGSRGQEAGGVNPFSCSAVNKWLLIMQMQMVEATAAIANCHMTRAGKRQRRERECVRERERLLQIVAYFFGLGSYEVPPVLWWLKFLQLCCAYETSALSRAPPPLPAIRFQSMHVLVVLDDSHVNQQPDNCWQLYSTRLDSQLDSRLSPRWHSPLQGVQLCLLADSHTHTLTHGSTIHLEAGHVLQLQL